MPVRGPSHFLEAMNSPALGAAGGRFFAPAAAPPPFAAAAPPLRGVDCGVFFAGVPALVGGDAERAGDPVRAGDFPRATAAAAGILKSLVQAIRCTEEYRGVTPLFQAATKNCDHHVAAPLNK